MKTDAQLDRLVTAAHSWEGTPFCAGAATKGRGVCCHRLVHEILVEAGWIPAVACPSGPPGWARSSNESLMEAWFGGPGAEWFVEVPVIAREPGDVLGCRFGRCVHHLGLLLPEGAVAHAVDGSGACIIPSVPPQWGRRLVKVWRVK